MTQQVSHSALLQFFNTSPSPLKSLDTFRSHHIVGAWPTLHAQYFAWLGLRRSKPVLDANQH